MLFSATQVTIVAITTQALVTGIYFASFLLCLRWLLLSDDGGALRKGIRWPFLFIAIVLFALSVTDFSLSLLSTLLTSQGISTLLYTGTITDFIEGLTPIITDCVLIFRCWVVYKKSWRIAILPVLLMLYNISSLLVMTYWNASNSITRTGPLLDRLIYIRGTFYASTIVINVYVTSAIILQIWRNCFSVHRLLFAIRIVTESGLLYTLTSIATFSAVFLNNHKVYPIASAISFPVAGIAYNLILIRVGQHGRVHIVSRGLLPREWTCLSSRVGLCLRNRWFGSLMRHCMY